MEAKRRERESEARAQRAEVEERMRSTRAKREQLHLAVGAKEAAPTRASSEAASVAQAMAHSSYLQALMDGLAAPGIRLEDLVGTSRATPDELDRLRNDCVDAFVYIALNQRLAKPRKAG